MVWRNYFLSGLFLALGLTALATQNVSAQERPFFVTYNHHLEEPGGLEIATSTVFGTQRTAGNFLGAWTEFEYGVKGWWTAEFYLDGQTTAHDSTLFTGFRIENRFRPLMREHWINPVIYVEFSNISGADKTLREIVGHDAESDQAESNSVARRERKREVETKLILSSNFKGWNLAENFIAEKNLSNHPWEFGYAIGLSRPLALAASAQRCNFCRENFAAGVEVYGGLGDRYSFGLKHTSHYLAPVVAWGLPNGTTLRISPGFGLNGLSHRFLLRFGVSYEIAGVSGRIRRMFSGSKP